MLESRSRALLGGLALGTLLLSGACSDDDPFVPTSSASGSASGSGADGGGGAGGSAAGGAGGLAEGGSGGADGGSGGSEGCTPGARQLCYEGPPGTDGFGICYAGYQTCFDDQTWGSCQEQVLPIPESCRTEVDDDCDGEANEGCLAWIHGYQSVFEGSFYPVQMNGLAIGPSDEVVVGADGPETDFGAGVEAGRGHVVKLDAAGDLLWTRSLVAEVSSAAIDASGNVVVGSLLDGSGNIGEGPIGDGTSSEACVTKLDAVGNVLWTRHYPVGVDFGYPVLVDTAPNGDIWVVGAFQGGPLTLGSFTLPASFRDSFIARFDAAGTVLSAQALGAEISEVRALEVDDSGAVFVGGRFSGDIAAWSLSAPLDGYSAFIAKLDASGNLAWAHDYLAPYGAVLEDIAVDAGGSAVATGWFELSIDLGSGPVPEEKGRFLVRIDPAGQVAWSHVWADVYATSTGLTVTPAGETVLAASFEGAIVVAGTQFTAAQRSLLLARLLPDGTLGATAVHAIDELPYDVVLDAQGQRVIAGRFGPSADFGFGAVTSMPFSEGTYLAKLPE